MIDPHLAWLPRWHAVHFARLIRLPRPVIVPVDLSVRASGVVRIVERPVRVGWRVGRVGHVHDAAPL